MNMWNSIYTSWLKVITFLVGLRTFQLPFCRICFKSLFCSDDVTSAFSCLLILLQIYKYFSKTYFSLVHPTHLSLSIYPSHLPLSSSSFPFSFTLLSPLLFLPHHISLYPPSLVLSSSFLLPHFCVIG